MKKRRTKNPRKTTKADTIRAICSLYSSLREEINTRLTLTLGLITVTVGLLGSVIAFMGATGVYDIGLIGGFGLLGLQFIYLEYTKQSRLLGYYLATLEDKLKELGVDIPKDGWQNYLFEINQKIGSIEIKRLKMHYTSFGVVILFLGSYTVLNILSFWENCDKHIIIDFIPSNLRIYIFVIIELMGVLCLIKFYSIIKKIEIEKKELEKEGIHVYKKLKK